MKCHKCHKCQNTLLAVEVPKVPPVGVALGAGTYGTSREVSGLLAPQAEPVAYLLRLRPVPGNWRAKPEYRLKGLLKSALRAWGFRATSVAPEYPKEKRP